MGSDGAVTGLSGITGLTDRLPYYAIITDDPMRTRMLSAHWLENTKVLYELRGMIGYTGMYKGAAIALLSAGYGETSALLYLHDACLLGARRVIYTGECVSQTPEVHLRDVIIAKGGDEKLTGCALRASKQFSIPTSVREAYTNDRMFLGDPSFSGDIVDYASYAVAGYASKLEVAAISVLTVSQNTATGERVEEHERQSRFNTAAQLAFETIAIDADC